MVKAIDEQEEKFQQLEIISQRLQEKLEQLANGPVPTTSLTSQTATSTSEPITYVHESTVVPRGEATQQNPVDLCICYYTSTGERAVK